MLWRFDCFFGIIYLKRNKTKQFLVRYIPEGQWFCQKCQSQIANPDQEKIVRIN